MELSFMSVLLFLWVFLHIKSISSLVMYVVVFAYVDSFINL